MPKFMLPPQPGRPKRHPVDVLFTRLWVSAVKEHSGLAAPHAIEQMLEPHLVRVGGDGVKRSRKWHLYESGARVPQRQGEHPSSVDLADARYPGTAAYFEAPIRALLRGDSVDAQWVEDKLAGLTPAVASLLFEPTLSRTGRRITRAFDEECAERLVELAGFDALQAAALLMTKAQQIASPLLRDLAWQAYVALQPAVAAMPAIAPLADELFMLIDTNFKRWLFLRPDQRHEVVLFTGTLRGASGGVEMAKVREVEELMAFMIRDQTSAEPKLSPPPLAERGGKQKG